MTMNHLLTTLFLASAVCANAQTLSDSLIAHFPLDGSPDDVIGGLAPTVTAGMPSFCTDRFGNPNGAACFDGASFWSYGDVLDMDTSDFSISAWCRVDGLTTGTTAHDYPIAKGTTVYGTPAHSGYAFGFRDELPDTLSVAFMRRDEQNNLQVTSYPTVFGAWRHLLINHCDTLLALYLDGDEVNTDTLSLDLDFSTNIFFSIGAEDRNPGGSPAGFFQGAVDEVRIYKGRCLSQAEISVLAGTTVDIGNYVGPEYELRLSPNPSTGILRIDLPPSVHVTARIAVINTLGQPVPFGPVEFTMTHGRVGDTVLDVSGLPSGPYFVVVPTERGRLYGRFIKK